MSSNSSNSCVQIDAPPPPLSAGRRSRLAPTASEKGPVVRRTFTFRQVSGDQEAGAGLWGRRMTQLDAGLFERVRSQTVSMLALNHFAAST